MGLRWECVAIQPIKWLEMERWKYQVQWIIKIPRDRTIIKYRMEKQSQCLRIRNLKYLNKTIITNRFLRSLTLYLNLTGKLSQMSTMVKWEKLDQFVYWKMVQSMKVNGSKAITKKTEEESKYGQTDQDTMVSGKTV